MGALLPVLLVGNFGVRRSTEQRSVHVEIKEGLRFCGRRACFARWPC
jgi:hypothetical protein